jgi:hypothetical protein
MTTNCVWGFFLKEWVAFIYNGSSEAHFESELAELEEDI